jgi:cell division protease FtsH
MSEETMRKVDAAIRVIIDKQYSIARELIEANQDKMHAMAKALLEFETIDADQIDDIMSGKPARLPKDWNPPAGGGKSDGGVPPVVADSAPAAA